MKNAPRLAVIAAAICFSFVGVSFADNVSRDVPTQLLKTVAAFHDDFDVEFGNEFNRAGYQNNPYARPLSGNGVAMLQAAIRANKPLEDRLRATGISVGEIIDAEQHSDGSLTFYARHDMR
jgi:hypothetical protein